MVLRVLTLLIAIVMMAGATSPVDVPVADDASAVDLAATPDAAVPPAIAITEPPRVAVLPADPPVDHTGRFHAVTVFRPPRSFASR